MDKIFSVKVQEIRSPEDSPGNYVSLPYSFDPGDKVMEEQRGKLFAVLDISGEGILKEDLNAGAKLVFNVLRETYFGELESTPLQALEKAFHAAKEKVSNMPLSGEEVVPHSLDLNLIVAVLWGKVLYVAQFGAGSACIVKEATAINIGKGSEGEVVISSGIVEKGDVLVLGSGNFGELFKLEDLPKNFSKLSDLEFLKANKIISAVVVKFDVLNFWGSDDAIKFVAPAKIQSAPKFISRLFRKERTIKVPSTSFEARSRKKAAVLGAIAVILIGTLAFSIKLSSKKASSPIATDNKGTSIVEELGNKLSQAKGLIGKDEEKAKEILLEISSYEEASQDNQELKEVLGSAVSLLDEVEGVIPIDNAKEVFDASSDNIDPAGLSYAEGVLYLWSAVADTGVRVIISGETPTSSKITFTQAPLFVDAYDGDIYALNSSGITKSSGEDTSFVEQPVSGDVDFASAKSFKIYYGNGYILTSKTIAKLAVLDEGFSASEWLKIPLSLERAIDLALDGNVYVLFSDSGVRKLYIGEEDSAFMLKDLPSTLKEPKFIYTTIDMNDLYIFDAGDGSIVVVDKVGEFQKKYRIKEAGINFSAVRGFVVNTDVNKAYILVGSKVFELGL